MKQQTFGATVAALRKERGMTQLELAEQMGVTDKAVSKWERDLSLPDTASLPKLAETLGVTVDELMLGTSVILFSAPPAMVLTLITIQCGSDEAYASECVFIGTVLSALTMPATIWLLLM